MKSHFKLAKAIRTSGTGCVVLAALVIPAASLCYAQGENAPSHVAAHRKAKPRVDRPEVVSAPMVPEAPPKPDWPVNNPPAQPSVTWDAQGLRIQAANASLRQILNDVATTTGSKLEGLSHDERVFGTYGPGPAREVLSQLLHGSGYNVLMLGDLGEGAPRQITLSARAAGKAPGNFQQEQPTPRAMPNAVQQEDEDVPEVPVEDQPPIAPPQALQQPNGGPPNMTPLGSQERVEQMQRMQQEMQRQQMQQLQQLQQQQQNQPPQQ